MTEEPTEEGSGIPEDISVTEWIRLCLTGITFFATSCSMTLQGIFSIPIAIKMGLSESLSSLVWLCGPITGMIVQPLIGRWSDRYVSHGSGRSRAPFLIKWEHFSVIKPPESCCDSLPLQTSGPSHIGGLAVLIIIFWIYDAAANVVMVVSRSALVDVAPSKHLSAGFFTQTFISDLGILCAGWIASRDWSEASWIDLGSEICPRKCSGGSCPVEFVPGCYGLRVSVIVDAFIVLVTASISVSAMLWKSRDTARYEALRTTQDLDQVEQPSPVFSGWTQYYQDIRTDSGAFRTIIGAMALSWFGWFSLCIYRSHFIAAQILPNPSDDSQVYERNLNIAARGIFHGSILSAMASALFSIIGVRFPQMLNPRLWMIWGCSLLGLALILLLSILFAVGVFTGTIAGVQTWLALAGPLGALAMTVPFALTGRIAQRVADDSSKPGTYMGALNLSICLPQIFVALLGGPLNSLFGSDAASFVIGGVGVLGAAAVLLRKGSWYDRCTL
ncbi:hypothetical protein FOZ61_007996 [Perkinsus olseni]|uniref:Uncharacterized protein n=1 Tax=Perkinsus olseni TaxID=32597 RepID=A0A7J6LEZ0_PEROL|nr:hypothetical protein FOZ61_007996 [Perkinsus olseni]KAF4657805.1 hypothetical protein FOL46_007267 [Perkinsus olseni]